MTAQGSVTLEEIIVLPTCELRRGKWRGRAHVLGHIVILGQSHDFDSFVDLTFLPTPKDIQKKGKGTV